MQDCKFFLCFILLFISLSCGEKFVDDRCTLPKSTAEGICKLLEDCPSALEAIKHKKYPVACGYVGSNPVVCCDKSSLPVATTIPTTTKKIITTTRRKPILSWPANLPVGEKSKRKCEEYSSYVYETKAAPVLLVRQVAITQSVCGFNYSPFIVGGQNAAIKEFPHQALLGYGQKESKTWLCGGSLISEQYILTAAHCTNNQQHGNVKWIRMGMLEMNKHEEHMQEFNVAVIIRHPKYAPPMKYNDLALLKLDRAVSLNGWIRPACLQTEYNIHNTSDGTNQTYVATGWGLTSFGGSGSSNLLKVVLDDFSNDKCNFNFSRNKNRQLPEGIVAGTMICAGGISSAKDTCQGDSGGPLQIYHPTAHCMYSVVGVTAFGMACGIVNLPGVYIRVSHFVEWIENIVWPNATNIIK